MTNTRRCVLLIMCLFVPAYSKGADKALDGEGLRLFVNAAIKRIASSPISVPQLSHAELETVVNWSPGGKDEQFLCWLQAKGKRVGYIVAEGTTTGYRVIAFSATCAEIVPSLVKRCDWGLPTEGAARSPNTKVLLVTNVPLVAVTRTRVGATQVETTDLACSAASWLGYLQYGLGIPLFGHIDYFANTNYLRRSAATTNRLVGNVAEARRDTSSSNTPPRRPYQVELSEAFQREGIAFRGRPEEIAAARVKARELSVSIRRRRLLDPQSPQERFEMLRGEDHDACSVMSPDTSRGMRDALLLQMDYLGRETKDIGHDFEAFFATRGFATDVKVCRVGDLSVDHTPAVLLADGRPSGVLLGSMPLDGAEFLVVFLPTTGSPQVMPLGEKIQAIKAACPNKPVEHMPSAVRSNMMARFGSEIRRAESNHNAFVASQVFVEDLLSGSPAAFEKGVHIVRSSALRSWNALYLEKMDAGTNWGGVGQR